MGFYPDTGNMNVSGNLTVTGNISSNGIVQGATIDADFGNLETTFAGTGLAIKAGSNCYIGAGTLTAGTVTISNTSVAANTHIFITPTTTSTNSGTLAVTSITAGTSFTVTSSDSSDTASFNYLFVKPN